MLPLISLEGVSKLYAARGKSVVGTNDVSFEVFPNEIVSLIGPSGCGKTTILKMIANVIEPSSGSILYEGSHISVARKRGLLGYVPQNISLFPNLTVAENIAFPLRIKRTFDMQKVVDGIKIVDLDGFENYYPHQLSGGMKQKVSIARALVHSPEVILIDEPFSSLDEITREKLDSRLLSVFYALKPAIVFVTHSVEEAVFLSTRILIMSKGPGRILHTVKVDLPERRDSGTRDKEEFFREVVKVRKKIKEYE